MLNQIFTENEFAAVRDNAFPFLAEGPTIAMLRKREVIVFGAGLYGKETVKCLLRHNIAPSWVTDNNKAYWGTRINNIPVMPPDSLLDADSRYVLLTSGHCGSMFKDCKKYGVKSVLLPRDLPFGDLVGKVIGRTVEELESIVQLPLLYSLLADEVSRRILKSFLSYQITLDNGHFRGCGPADMYFPAELSLDYSRFVDAGAFDGDTLRCWLQKISSDGDLASLAYAAFEPSPDQFEYLQQYAHSLPPELVARIRLFHSALGASEGTMFLSPEEQCREFFSHTHNLELASLTEKVEVQVSPLDSILEGFVPTMIKADIEGAELAMLEGAERTIRKHRPCLAISVYHKAADIWELPLWIHSLGLGYKLYLRHHQATFTDTVCYAIAE